MKSKRRWRYHWCYYPRRYRFS